MTYSIDQSLSLMIPRVFPQWIDEQKIIDIFHQQQIGNVYKVSIIRSPDCNKRGYPIYQAFIYFNAWYENAIAFHFQQRIFGPRGQARVVYDDPWFWVVFKNTKRRLRNADRRMIRLGYLTYLNEQAIVQQDLRLQKLEDQAKQAQAQQFQAQQFQAQQFQAQQFQAQQFQAQQVQAEQAQAQQFQGQPLQADRCFQQLEDQRLIQESLHYWASDPVAPTANANAAYFSWNKLSEEVAMKTLGTELELTETAIAVAEAVLAEDANELSAELEMTETATNVAELALAEDQAELNAELDLTETANRVAEAALADDDSYESYYSDNEYDSYDY